MKTLKILAIILLILTALHAIARGQNKLPKLELPVYKVNIPNTNLHWKFASLDDCEKVATLHKDTLFVHKPELIKIKEQSNELRYLRWKGVTYRYQYAFVDKAYFYGRMKGVSIW